MKTALVIPDTVFRTAEDMARCEGVSLDDLCAKALSEYAQRHSTGDPHTQVERINAVCREVDTSLDEGFKALRDAGLSRERW